MFSLNLSNITIVSLMLYPITVTIANKKNVFTSMFINSPSIEKIPNIIIVS